MDQDSQQPKVVFEGEEFQRPQSFESSTPKIIQLVIDHSGGYIESEKQAGYLLMGLVVLAIVISLFLFFSGGSASPPVNLSDPSLFLPPI